MSDPPSAEPDRYADRAPPLAPYAAAAWAHHEGRPSTLRLRSSLGEDEDFPVEIFFRSEGFFPFERFALELCRG
ncbi:MAG: hypothetical protein R3266_07780, partial [Gemmatimonadota bacterium]|nr:hypothetical protein [Gemmatimonadota bacterium]